MTSWFIQSLCLIPCRSHSLGTNSLQIMFLSKKTCQKKSMASECFSWVTVTKDCSQFVSSRQIFFCLVKFATGKDPSVCSGSPLHRAHFLEVKTYPPLVSVQLSMGVRGKAEHVILLSWVSYHARIHPEQLHHAGCSTVPQEQIAMKPFFHRPWNI